MELDFQSLFGLMCTAVLIGRDLATPPSLRVWVGLIYEGRYWSAEIDYISFQLPAQNDLIRIRNLLSRSIRVRTGYVEKTANNRTQVFRTTKRQCSRNKVQR
jgi:hypothetical protein